LTADRAVDTAAAIAPPKLDRPARASGWSALLAGGTLLGAGVLFAIDPAQHEIYPTCWFYATTGWQCPGCGGLRATHQLLHGHLAVAWALNPLAVLLVPLGAWCGLDAALSLVRGRGLPYSAPRPALIWLGLASALIFGLARNLPWF
jgi:hypothetical protein